MKRVYFAGKIEKGGGYREKIFKNSRVMSNGYHEYRINRGVLLYGGPFAVACDHGCFHVIGGGSHGFGSEDPRYPECGGACLGIPPDKYGEYDKIETSNSIVSRCIQQIENADAIHAYIDLEDCYGTLVELGYAAACKKPIYLVFSKNLRLYSGKNVAVKHGGDTPRDELWFVRFLPSIVDCRQAEPSFIHPDLVQVPYKEYLHWRKIRVEAIARANHRCQLCNKDNILHVHHRTYERLRKELPEDLIVLCQSCYLKFHTS